MSTILEVNDLKKHFNVSAGTLHAVDGVSFSLQQGQTLGVVGESGCGKSTLGRVILHLLDNTGGQILYKDRDITKVNRKELSDLRKEMQLIFQDPFSSLNPRMTVYQTIEEPMRIAGGYSSTDIQNRVYKMMDTVGLARRLVNAYPHELDGGRRQRIGIARALVLEPRFIVCDEPVSALDVSIQAQILNLMLDIQEEMKLTYLFITHDLSVVKYISNDIMVMYLGQMVERTNADELFANPVHPYTQALLAAVPIPDVKHVRKRILLKGELTSPINPEKRCRFCSRCRYVKEICRTQELEVKDIGNRHEVRCHFADIINEKRGELEV